MTYDLSQQAGIPVTNRDAYSLEGLRILIVDDSYVARYILQMFLEKGHAETICAETGHQALSILQSKTVDCVFMDIQLPGIDGYDTIREIRKKIHTSKLFVIAITSNPLEEVESACLEAGANGVLIKPLMPEELYSALQCLRAFSTLLKVK